MAALSPNSRAGYLVSVLVGIIFGFVMNKARVIEPLVIRDQMVMSRFVMLKLFLTASATSALSFALLYSFKKTRSNVLTCQNNMGSLMNRGFLPFIVGGLLLGAGLDIAGTCPGMVYVELGALVQNSWWTILGCFVGTFMYTRLQPWIERLSTSSSRYPKTVMEATGKDYPILAILYAILLYLIVAIVEYFVPWTRDVRASEVMSFHSYAWSPIVAGIVIGLLQLPLNGLLGKMIGTSMSYITILAQFCSGSQELDNNRNNWWQVFLAGGSVLGSFISSFLYMGNVNVYNPSVQGVRPVIAFIGGVLLLLGAKTMRACTSGHGLSGMALLVIPSIVATCSIFAGGIATGLLLNKFISSVSFQTR